MKITEVRTHLLTAQWANDPFYPQYLYSTAFVQIMTDVGIDGVGEITLAYFAPEATPGLVDFFKLSLIGKDPFSISRLTQGMLDESIFWARNGAARSVISGLDMALWDLKGKALKVPSYELMGGAVRDTVPVYASGGGSTLPVEINIRHVEQYLKMGYTSVKLSPKFYKPFPVLDTLTGLGRPEEIVVPYERRLEVLVENFGALRREFGDKMGLAIDGQQGGYPAASADPITEALEMVEALAPFRLRFYEEPLAYTNLQGYAELAARSRIPIAGGESLSGMDQFDAFISKRALHMIQPDVGFAGGPTEVLKIVHHAEANNIHTAIHTGATIGPALAASWHMAAATQSIEWLEIVIATGAVQKEFLVDELTLKDGRMSIPQAPGFGIRLNDDLLRKYKFVPGSGARL